MSPAVRAGALAFSVLVVGVPAFAVAAQPMPPETHQHAPLAAQSGLATRNGREIYRNFREGLADPDCPAESSARWRQHFAADSRRLTSSRDDLLPLFGYVVDALREAHLPTEYALIPFVESGYRPGARSPSGPAGMWQMIARTARNHGVPVRPGYDGRLSPVDSTKAAVRYLKTLHGMFAGDWRLAAMAYNAGEYRIFGALRRGGQVARDAQPEKLPGLAPITQTYVRKLHALSCLLVHAEQDEEWLRAVDRPVPHLQAVTLPPGSRGVDQWARRNDQDAGQLRRLNPHLGGTGTAGGTRRLLAATTPSGAMDPLLEQADPLRDPPATAGDASAGGRHHTVLRGDNASLIAARYGVRLGDLLERNGLTLRSVLRPGHVLQIDAAAASAGDEPAADTQK